jgi:threonine/homoserine/homoserine lactone efflux protein
MESWLQFFGGIFLVALGLKTALAQPPARDATEGAPPPPTRSWHTAYLSTLALTLASPATIIAFVAIFAGVGLGVNAASPLHAFELVAGVFVGSAVWWAILSLGAGLLRDRLHARTLHVMHVISGLGIVALGLWQGVLLVSKWLG